MEIAPHNAPLSALRRECSPVKQVTPCSWNSYRTCLPECVVFTLPQMQLEQTTFHEHESFFHAFRMYP